MISEGSSAARAAPSRQYIESQSVSCSNSDITDLDDTPPEVTSLAEACVRFVHDALDLTLDYTAETLPILDHYLERARGQKQEIIDLLAPAAGAYFGEVVRRSIAGARWYCEGENYSAYRLEWEPFFLCFNPIGAALEALTMQDAEGYGTHFQVLDEAREAVTQSLEAAGEVDSEYYTLSVRLEALEQVADVLFGIESRQSKRRAFGRDVYRAARGEPTGDGSLS